MNKTQTIPANKKNYFQNRYSQANKEATRNPWFLAILGIIVVFLVVNFIFIGFAIGTNPGLVSDDYYEQGREHERNVETRSAARNNLNWETKMEIPKRITINKADTYRFSAVDSRGVSIMDAEVTFTLYRPSDVSADFVMPVEQIAPGLYQTTFYFPLPGIWDINLKVTHGDDVYHQTRRISVHMPTMSATNKVP
ncbi:MAG: FixH family protein [Gammaproteobacteria bacterium]|nr:FixH family protein [Gammaproteobacteria bacterium]